MCYLDWISISTSSFYAFRYGEGGESVSGQVLTEPQSVVCIAAIQTCKSLGIITYRDFNSDEAKKCT